MSTLGRSIFDKVATKEDDYTQLLCNLMQRNEGKGFRIAVLSKLLGDPILAAEISPDQISTQVVTETGRPDIVIKSAKVWASIEIKLNPRRGRTEYQTFGLKGYRSFLEGAPPSIQRRVFAFLVPANLEDLENIKSEANTFRQENRSITVTIVLWEEIFSLSKQFCTDPLHLELWKLLQQDFSPVKFTEKEVGMAVNAKMLPVRTIHKLEFVVDKIAERCKKNANGFSVFGPEHYQSGDWYVLEFYRRRSGPKWGETFFFYFGIWSAYTESNGQVLSFGVFKDKKADREAFLKSYSGVPKEFSDPQTGEDWVLGCISESLLEESSGYDPVDNIWRMLKPILDAVYAAES